MVEKCWVHIRYECSILYHTFCDKLALNSVEPIFQTLAWSSAILSHGWGLLCDRWQHSEQIPISINSGTDRLTNVVQLHWRMLPSSRRCSHRDQSSTICNSIKISADFSEEIEDWLFQRSYMTSSFLLLSFFVTWP